MKRCPICSSPAVRTQRGGFSVLQCTDRVCGHRLLDLDAWTYPYADRDYYQSIDPGEIRPDRPFIASRVRLLERFSAPPGRAAELGCGLGETAIRLAQQGFEVVGVEESLNAVSFLRQHYPLVRWECRSIVDFLSRREPFDIMTLFHVLEHIPDAAGLMQLVHAGLRPQGIVLIEVPDVEGGLARLRGDAWEYWLDHHVHYFSRRSLLRLMGPLGFELVYARNLYHLGYPQGVWYKDLIHGVLARAGMNSIIRTLWRKVR
jgi:SAM-dependent methyltransferase